MNPEQVRLAAHAARKANWKEWGPYLSNRAWATVREDYSEDGRAWDYFPHDHARSRAYRWNEDGLGGISDRNQYLCFAWAFWNGKDPILKERFYGLTGPQGNHGEDLKEFYFYLDNLPTHSYMKMLYKYPQGAFPYELLNQENQKRSYKDKEFELADTGIFDEKRYFDIEIEYAKAAEEDILIRLTVHNRGPESAYCAVLPTLWFRNTWSWGYLDGPMGDVPGKPVMKLAEGVSAIEATHPVLGTYYLYLPEQAEVFFTENETHNAKLFGTPNASAYVKDAFHRALIQGEKGVFNPAKTGTKGATVLPYTIGAGAHVVLQLRLCKTPQKKPFANVEALFAEKKREADLFYATLHTPEMTADTKLIQRQAFAGLLWNKQLYYFDAEQWIKGDPPPQPPAPKNRRSIRNQNWEHLVNFDIFSMPDKWEYPWFASWDLAFHCIPLVLVDSDFAKRQLTLMTREWYMHPNGQLPAYEWEFSDVNPPVLAWSAWRVYKIDAKQSGRPDTDFLKGIFNKLLMNFTWWVNIKDEDGMNVFQGGFLGMDNISLFDRSRPLPTGGRIDQSDGTAWMGFYCMTMLKIALELSKTDPVYQDIATKYFEHFLRIAGAMSNCGGVGVNLWNEEDGFYYDSLRLPNESIIPLKVRSLVGLLPLLAVETLEPIPLKHTPIFMRRVEWFIEKKPHVAATIACTFAPGAGARRLLSIVTKEKLVRVLKYMLDENEFLSEYGIRSLSKIHQKHPYQLHVEGMDYQISYQPAEAETGLFGGNSNWRGPIWFPLNFLLIEALQRYHHYYGDSLKVEFPTGSSHMLNLKEVAGELSKRLMRIFEKDPQGRRPVFLGQKLFNEDPDWQDLLLFYEYFHGDTGAGLGANHQTGWTALIAKLIQQTGS